MEKIQSRLGMMIIVILVSFLIISPMQFTSARSDAGKEFLMGLSQPVISLNPYTGIYESDYLLYSYVYDYLVSIDEDGLPAPSLACGWFYMDGNYAAATGTDFNNSFLKNAERSYSPEEWPSGSIWQYNLTPNVKWNDGSSFIAADVVWTLNLQSGPNFATYWANQPYTRWIHHAEKLNDLTVRVFFSEHSTDFSGNPMPIAWGDSLHIPILPEHLFVGKSASYVQNNWDGIPTIGTGPFMGTDNLPDEIINKESVTLVKNPYWRYKINDTDAVATGGLGGFYNRTIEIEKIIMKFYSEEESLIADLEINEIDVGKISSSNYLDLAASLPENMRVASIDGLTGFAKCSHWNANVGSAGTLNPARLDPAVWRASQLATNKTKLVDTVFKGLGTPGVGIISPVFPKWYYDVTKDTTNVSTFEVKDANGTVVYNYTATMKDILKYDIARANAILDAAGYVWTGTVGSSVRKIGLEAAKRLVAMGYALDLDGAMYDSDMNPRTLRIEDIYDMEVYEDKETAEFYAAEWKAIGINLVSRPIEPGMWNEMPLSLNFAETDWTGDTDPNYLLYISTTLAMNGWNNFGLQNPEYDALYYNQSMAMNVSERSDLVKECQKWQYLNTGMIWTCYPKTFFAYYEYNRWVNWGNWTEHPGLAIDHFWGETPLFFQLTRAAPCATGCPVSPDMIASAIVAASIFAVSTVILVRYRRTRKNRTLAEEDEVKSDIEEENQR